MRARNIKPGIFDNETLGTADPLITILFAGLWCIADREGRLEDRPVRIRAKIFPYRSGADVEVMLAFLHQNGFVVRYSIGGQNLIQIAKWHKHQAPHHKEAGSALPPPSLDHAQAKLDPSMSHTSGNNGVKNNVNPPDSLIPDSLIPDSCASINQMPSKAQIPKPDPLKANAAARRIVEYFIRHVSDKGQKHKAIALVAEILITHPKRTEADLIAAADAFRRVSESRNNGREWRIGAATFFSGEWTEFLDLPPPPTADEVSAEKIAKTKQQTEIFNSEAKNRAQPEKLEKLRTNGQRH